VLISFTSKAGRPATSLSDAHKTSVSNDDDEEQNDGDTEAAWPGILLSAETAQSVLLLSTGVRRISAARVQFIVAQI